MRKWRKGPLASFNQPTWSEGAREQKRRLSHFQIALSSEKSQWVWQAHSQIQGSLLLLGCTVYLLASEVLVGYEKVKRTRQSQARGGRCYEGRLWNKQKHKVSITDQ